MSRTVSKDEVAQGIEAVKKEGYCLLKGILSQEKLTKWYEAFLPLLERHIEREGHLRNRGAHRYYVTLPFDKPFSDPEIFENDAILAIVFGLVGNDAVLCQLATDTPVFGSDYQEIHRDAPPLFPELEAETPAFQLAVNFPLTEVTLDNGPMEVARATHLMTKDFGLQKLAANEVTLEPITMALGDVLIRDVRGLHRGTPNHTPQPRPMVVLGYSRRWLFRPEVSIEVPRAVIPQLSPRAQQLLRFNPQVEELRDSAESERYQSFSY